MSARRPWLLPLAPLWWVGTAVKNALYDARVLRARRLERPVISVGSCSAGGAGKTPVVLMLARLLHADGFEVDVLSRGYGRRSRAAAEVDPAGTAEQFGDEPLELARAGLHVFVAAERFEAGRVAEVSGAARVHLLDDGFQHRRLSRSLDLVLLTWADVEDVLLPAGNLREPLRALRRADVVLVREEEAAALKPYCSGEVWLIQRRLLLPAKRPMRPFAFCGLARPEGFFSMLEEAGCTLAGRMQFPDHHAYRNEDFARLVDAARPAGADGWMTTAKDLVKISEVARRRLEGVGPVFPVELRAELVDPGRALRRLKQVIGE